MTVSLTSLLLIGRGSLFGRFQLRRSPLPGRAEIFDLCNLYCLRAAEPVIKWHLLLATHRIAPEREQFSTE
jgi:hypothetical protein